MAWAKVDDKLHMSVKWRRASKGARALWTTALSWCSDQETGGEVPRHMLRALDGTLSDAKNLVSVGLWDEVRDGWTFHDWSEYNPDAASARAVREAKSEGAQRSNHVRWHVKRHVTVPGCEFCESHPGSHLRSDSDSHMRSDTDQISDGVSDQYPSQSLNPPVPVPVPDREKKTSSEVADATSRPDADELLDYLDQKIREYDPDAKLPTRTKKNRDAARLLIDKDKRTVAQIKAAIDFSQDDEFWRPNIRSMSKLREKYDQLRLKAQNRPSSNVHHLPDSNRRKRYKADFTPEEWDALPVEKRAAIAERGTWS